MLFLLVISFLIMLDKGLICIFAKGSKLNIGRKNRYHYYSREGKLI